MAWATLLLQLCYLLLFRYCHLQVVLGLHECEWAREDAIEAVLDLLPVEINKRVTLPHHQAFRR